MQASSGVAPLDAAATVPRLCVVGPLPPPPGGMANQCEQLVRLLRHDGMSVELVRTNEPYRPAWVGRLPLLRAAARLLPYLWRLWSVAGRVQVMHVFANSGWAWHLFAAPALLVARWRSVAVIVNYRGGAADAFFARAPGHVHALLRQAALRVAPSPFLQRVFAAHGLDVEVIPNIIDLSRFRVQERRAFGDAPHLVVARNLEPIYDIATALRAFAAIRLQFPRATLTVAGTGPELERLQRLAVELGVAASARFSGRIDNERMPDLYATADCVLNPSTIDNMPISLLEALACGVPVVSTDAGGIPDMVTSEVNALLVPVGDDRAMAQQACRVLHDAELAARLQCAGAEQAAKYGWPQVRRHWLDAYRRAAASARGAAT